MKWTVQTCLQTLVDANVPLERAVTIVSRTYDVTEGDDSFQSVVNGPTGFVSVGAYALWAPYRRPERPLEQSQLESDATAISEALRAPDAALGDIIDLRWSPSAVITSTVRTFADLMRQGHQFPQEASKDEDSIPGMLAHLHRTALSVGQAIESIGQSSFDFS